MARTDLATQQIVIGGLKPIFTAANADGHAIENDGSMVLYVKNGSGVSINVTAVTPGTVDGNAVADRVVAVPAGEDRIIGRFLPAVYNQTNGKVNVDFSAVTTVTVAALKR